MLVRVGLLGSALTIAASFLGYYNCATATMTTTTATTICKDAVVTVEVAVVGNGPAALAASALLAGHVPFFRDDGHDDDDGLRSAVRDEVARVAVRTGADPRDVSLLQLDLPRLAAHVLHGGGRSNNPVALLVDALLRPGADAGGHGSLVEIRHVPSLAVPHVTIGSGAPGGSWHDMAPGTVTLSPGTWMELPGLGLLEGATTADSVHVDVRGRVDRRLVKRYYRRYYDRFVPPASRIEGRAVRAIRESEQEDPRWRLRVDTTNNSAGAGNGTCPSDDHDHDTTKDELEVRARHLVLATGMYDRPRRLPKVNLPASSASLDVFHRCPHEWPDDDNNTNNTVLVVGGGLSAADCVVAALRHRWRVVHVFRTSAQDTKLGDKFDGAGGMYQDYGALVRMMKSGNTGTDHGYEPFAHAELTRVEDDGTCTVTQTTNDNGGTTTTVRVVRRLVVLVGSTPDLSFVQRGVGSTTTIPSEVPVRARNGPSLLGSGAVPVLEQPTPPHHHPLRSESITQRAATHPVFVDVDPWTLEVDVDDDGGRQLYAFGPLRGDNFVRFLVGDAWPLVQRLHGWDADDVNGAPSSK